MSSIEIEITAKTYRTIQAEIKELEAQAETLKQRMISEMVTRQVDKLTTGEYTLCYATYKSSRLDGVKLKAEHADLYAAYCKEIPATRFQVA